MDAYRTVIDANKLDGVLDLPEEFKNQQVSVIIMRDFTPRKAKDPERIEAAIQKFCSYIPASSPYRKMSDDQIREERISEKYGIKFAD